MYSRFGQAINNKLTRVVNGEPWIDRIGAINPGGLRRKIGDIVTIGDSTYTIKNWKQMNLFRHTFSDH